MLTKHCRSSQCVETANHVKLIKTVFKTVSIRPATVLKTDCILPAVEDGVLPKCDVTHSRLILFFSLLLSYNPG